MPKSSRMPYNSSHPSGFWGDFFRYRFSFNGQEKDDEISGTGNTMTAQFWEYDTRLGRRFNCDPIVNPTISIYACFKNNPIILVDKNGDVSRAGEWARNHLPGIVAAPAAGTLDFFGGLGVTVGGLATLNSEKIKRGLTDMRDGFLGIFGLKEALTEEWVLSPTGGRVPTSIADDLAFIQSELPKDAARFGMHAWHGGSSAYISHKLGPVGALAMLIFGIIHETPLDKRGFEPEKGQGKVNMIADAVMDVVSNFVGAYYGLFSELSPEAAGEKGMEVGNKIPGPHEPDPKFGGKGPYNGKPGENWDLGSNKKTETTIEKKKPD